MPSKYGFDKKSDAESQIEAAEIAKSRAYAEREQQLKRKCDLLDGMIRDIINDDLSSRVSPGTSSPIVTRRDRNNWATEGDEPQSNKPMDYVASVWVKMVTPTLLRVYLKYGASKGTSEGMRIEKLGRVLCQHTGLKIEICMGSTSGSRGTGVYSQHPYSQYGMMQKVEVTSVTDMRCKLVISEERVGFIRKHKRILVYWNDLHIGAMP